MDSIILRVVRCQWALVFAAIGLTCLPQEATAVPAFARQMNAECSTCHYQHFAKLNAFGRFFKTSGYSMTARETLDGKDLSIAPNLNATFFLSSQFTDRSFYYAYETDDNNAYYPKRGTWGVGNEAAILIGGRLAEGIGGIVEWGGPLLSAKISMTQEARGMRLGTTLYTTDALGPGYGMELANTGAVPNQSPSARSSNATLGNNANLTLPQAATGIAFFASHSSWFATVSFYTPDSTQADLTQMDSGTELSSYLRAMWFPSFGGWEGGIGGGEYMGETHATLKETGSENAIVTRACFIDAQLQGTLGGRELGIYAIYAQGETPSHDNKIHLYQGSAERPHAFGLDGEYFVTSRLAVLASYGSHDDGSSHAFSVKQSYGLGLYWKIAQNLTLQPMYEVYTGDQGQDTGGDDVTQLTFTLDAAF